jgi:hypothetical protein
VTARFRKRGEVMLRAAKRVRQRTVANYQQLRAIISTRSTAHCLTRL